MIAIETAATLAEEYDVMKIVIKPASLLSKSFFVIEDWTSLLFI